MDRASDRKHEVSDKSLTTLKKVMYSQDEYGFEKYTLPLHHSYNYDWLHMFLEEMADGLKYIQNEMDRKEIVKKLIGDGLKLKDWEFIDVAFKILSKEGTGK